MSLVLSGIAGAVQLLGLADVSRVGVVAAALIVVASTLLVLR